MITLDSADGVWHGSLLAPAMDTQHDLGYFIGYRIAQAYYNRKMDKQQAIRDIITGNGGDVRALLAESGYNP